MRIEPAIAHNVLIEFLRSEYGLAIERLAFVPLGEVAHSYVVTCRDGTRYYLKLLDRTRLAEISAARLAFYLPLTDRLYTEGHFRYLPYPIRTRTGDLSTTFDGAPLVLFNYIAGTNPDEATLHAPGSWSTLARHVATIHRSIAVVDGVRAPIETFAIPFEAALLDGLASLSGITDADGEGRRALRDLLLPRRDAIRGYLDLLHALAGQARDIDPPLVLCHTDIHRFNLLLNGEGELYVLDWEGAMLAPREHDLFMFTGDHFPAFLSEYRRHAGDDPLTADLFAFYFYRRNLEDITDWIVRILYENTSEEQNRLDLQGIQEDCLWAWPYFERDVERVREQLRET